jgi:hypothetical protein
MLERYERPKRIIMCHMEPCKYRLKNYPSEEPKNNGDINKQKGECTDYKTKINDPGI